MSDKKRQKQQANCDHDYKFAFRSGNPATGVAFYKCTKCGKNSAGGF